MGISLNTIVNLMAAEIVVELGEAGHKITFENGQQAAREHVFNGKPEAMKYLQTIGIPMKVKTENFNGCKCSYYTVGKRTIFIG